MRASRCGRGEHTIFKPVRCHRSLLLPATSSSGTAAGGGLCAGSRGGPTVAVDVAAPCQAFHLRGATCQQAPQHVRDERWRFNAPSPTLVCATRLRPRLQLRPTCSEAWRGQVVGEPKANVVCDHPPDGHAVAAGHRLKLATAATRCVLVLLCQFLLQPRLHARNIGLGEGAQELDNHVHIRQNHLSDVHHSSGRAQHAQDGDASLDPANAQEILRIGSGLMLDDEVRDVHRAEPEIHRQVIEGRLASSECGTIMEQRVPSAQQDAGSHVQQGSGPEADSTAEHN
mmetsp:Transcript_72045/g.187512  ORF Transcript_72045/g.187512 Transcript_72045/m.187512 type:complete len:285 (+) Transcript_72045:234-1088(+)